MLWIWSISDAGSSQFQVAGKFYTWWSDAKYDALQKEGNMPHDLNAEKLIHAAFRALMSGAWAKWGNVLSLRLNPSLFSPTQRLHLLYTASSSSRLARKLSRSLCRANCLLILWWWLRFREPAESFWPESSATEKAPWYMRQESASHPTSPFVLERGVPQVLLRKKNERLDRTAWVSVGKSKVNETSMKAAFLHPLVLLEDVRVLDPSRFKLG